MNQIRPWPLQPRSNGTTRPSLFDIEGSLDKTVIWLSYSFLAAIITFHFEILTNRGRYLTECSFLVLSKLGQIVDGSQWCVFLETIDPGKNIYLLHGLTFSF